MNASAMPLPKVRKMKSSKSARGRSDRFIAARISPSKHSLLALGGKRWMLFWKGYGVQTPKTRTQLSR